MEALMNKKDTNEDNEVGELISKVPPFITAIIAVGGLIAAYFMTIGEFKVKDMELQQRMMYLEQKVEQIKSSLDTVQNRLEQRFPSIDAERQQLKSEIDNLKEVLQQTRQIILQKK